jgi:membrane-associated phospholipid phosphatase
VACPGLPDAERGWLNGHRPVAAAVGALALVACAKIGEDVFAHETGPFDEAVQRWVLGHQFRPLDQLFHAITVVGGINAMWALAALGTAFLLYRGRRHVVIPVLVAPAITDALISAVKRAYARPRPTGLGNGVDSSYSFPSAHATTSAAVCGTMAYVLWREQFIGPRTAIAFGVLVPLLVGFSRIYLNVHWATDVLGGWCAGLLIAVLSGFLYGSHKRRIDATRVKVQ